MSILDNVARAGNSVHTHTHADGQTDRQTSDMTRRVHNGVYCRRQDNLSCVLYGCNDIAR